MPQPAVLFLSLSHHCFSPLPDPAFKKRNILIFTIYTRPVHGVWTTSCHSKAYIFFFFFLLPFPCSGRISRKPKPPPARKTCQSLLRNGMLKLRVYSFPPDIAASCPIRQLYSVSPRRQRRMRRRLNDGSVRSIAFLSLLRIVLLCFVSCYCVK